MPFGRKPFIKKTANMSQQLLSKKDQRKRRREDASGTPIAAGKAIGKVDDFDVSDDQFEGLDQQSIRILKARILMNKRDRAREESDFTKSDKLREILLRMGIEVKDQKNGPSGWKFIDGSTTKLAQNVKVPEIATRKKLKTNQLSTGGNSGLPNSAKLPGQVSDKVKPIVVEQSRNKATLELIRCNSSSVKNIKGVLIEDLEVGDGTEAQSGKKVKVFYVGKLKSTGKVFDSSTKKPFSFKLGRSEVIQGWDIGVAGMCVGGHRRLTCPPEKAYGNNGAPPTIPGGATLIFDVQLLEVL